jgi:hypothetical protein
MGTASGSFGACQKCSLFIENFFGSLGTVIHRVVLAGFADEPRETEQSDAQNSEFTNSAGLSDHLFPHFTSLRGIVINDLSMKVVKDYWPPKTWAQACTLECFFFTC